MDRVYLDYNATTPVHPQVAADYQAALDFIGNPSSLHQYGQAAKATLEAARVTIAQSIDAVPAQLFFTSSGSEGNNHVLQALWQQSLRQNQPFHVITTATEHSSIRVTLDYLSQFGIKVTVLPVNTAGHISLTDLAEAMTTETRLLSIMWANNEVGTIPYLAQICDIAHQHNVLVHTDAVQALGKCSVSVQDTPVDIMTLSAHKLYAPKGSGAVYIKDHETLPAFIYGGGHERGHRAGTENVAGIVAFASAVSQLPNDKEWQRQRGLLDKIVNQLSENIPGLVIHSDHDSGLPNTLNLGVDGIDGHALAINLDLVGIGVSTGSACATGSIEPSPVLAAMGVPLSLNKGSIRVSLGTPTTEAEINYFCTEYINCINRMQS